MVASAALGSLSLCACDARTLGDDLQVNLGEQGSPAVVALDCGACTSELGVEVSFDPQAYVLDGDEVVLEQYRVDYELAGVRGKVPFFAGSLEQHVTPDDGAFFVITIAGSAQRAVVGNASGGDDIEGRATVTLAGYDSDDEQAIVEATVPIRFVHGGGPSQEPTP